MLFYKSASKTKVYISSITVIDEEKGRTVHLIMKTNWKLNLKIQILYKSLEIWSWTIILSIWMKEEKKDSKYLNRIVGKWECLQINPARKRIKIKKLEWMIKNWHSYLNNS